VSNIYISEVCIKLVALRINLNTRSSSQRKMVGDPWFTASKVTLWKQKSTPV